jgi:hypothetical protein
MNLQYYFTLAAKMELNWDAKFSSAQVCIEKAKLVDDIKQVKELLETAQSQLMRGTLTIRRALSQKHLIYGFEIKSGRPDKIRSVISRLTKNFGENATKESIFKDVDTNVAMPSILFETLLMNEKHKPKSASEEFPLVP